jgi:hypothetical protein
MVYVGGRGMDDRLRSGVPVRDERWRLREKCNGTRSGNPTVRLQQAIRQK